MRMLMLRLKSDESGATAIEYGLIAALVALGAVVALRAMGTDIASVFDRISANLS